MNSFSFIDKDDFERKLLIFGELYNEKNIEDILTKKIEDLKDFPLIDFIWDVCAEVHKDRLELKDLKLFSNTTNLSETNSEFESMVKEHVVFSTHFTIGNMLSKKVKLPLDCYDKELATTNCSECNEICGMCAYSNFLKKYDESYCKQSKENKQTILNEFIVRFDNGISKFIKETAYLDDNIPPNWLEDILDLCNFKKNKNVQHGVVDLLIHVVLNWKLTSIITHKYIHKLNYNDIIKLINSLESYIIHNSDVDQIYFMERCLNLSFMSELFILAEHFQSADIVFKKNLIESNQPKYKKRIKIADLKNKITIDVNNFNNYISKMDSGSEWKIFKRQFKNPLEHNLNADVIKNLDMPPHTMSREDFEKIFQGLSKFSLLPNSFSRNKFIYYAINSYYSRKSNNDLPAYALENWQEDISECAAIVTNNIIPDLENCFFYTLCIYLKKYNGEKTLIKNMEIANQILSSYITKNEPDMFSGLILYNQIHNESGKSKFHYSNIEDCNNILEIIMPDVRSYMTTDILKIAQYTTELRCSRGDSLKNMKEPGFRTKRKLKKSDYFFHKYDSH